MDFSVALQRCHEPESDRLDDGIDQVADVPPLQRLDVPVQGIHSLPEIGNDDHLRVAAEIAGDFQIAPVDTEDELGSGPHRGPNLIRIEAVDADPDPLLAEVADDARQLGKRHSWRTADVDDIGTARSIVGGGSMNL